MSYGSYDPSQVYSTNQWPNPYVPAQSLYSDILPPSQSGAEVVGDHNATVSAHIPLPSSWEQDRVYVNPKQYNRILKRRHVRALLEEKRKEKGVAAHKRPTYQHESRHRHATKRKRINGRFVSSECTHDTENNELDLEKDIADEELSRNNDNQELSSSSSEQKQEN